MMPVRRNNQTWLPSIFNDFFDNEWMEKANATAPAINVSESEREYKVEVASELDFLFSFSLRNMMRFSLIDVSRILMKNAS